MNWICPMIATLNFTICGKTASFTAWHTAEMDSAQSFHIETTNEVLFLKNAYRSLSRAIFQVFVLTISVADDKVMVVLNVYLPVDPKLATYTTEEYEECIAVLDHVLQSCPYDTVLIGGDFNTDPGRQKQQCITNSVYLQDSWFKHVLYWSFYDI